MCPPSRQILSICSQRQSSDLRLWPQLRPVLKLATSGQKYYVSDKWWILFSMILPRSCEMKNWPLANVFVSTHMQWPWDGSGWVTRDRRPPPHPPKWSGCAGNLEASHFQVNPSQKLKNVKRISSLAQTLFVFLLNTTVK